MSKSGLMAGKRGLIMGVANDRSLAWGIAKACVNAGAEVAFTYQGEALEKRVRPLAEEAGARLVLPADVTDSTSMDEAFQAITRATGIESLDELVDTFVHADRRNYSVVKHITALGRDVDELTAEVRDLKERSKFLEFEQQRSGMSRRQKVVRDNGKWRVVGVGVGERLPTQMPSRSWRDTGHTVSSDCDAVARKVSRRSHGHHW